MRCYAAQLAFTFSVVDTDTKAWKEDFDKRQLQLATYFPETHVLMHSTPYAGWPPTTPLGVVTTGPSGSDCMQCSSRPCRIQCRKVFRNGIGNTRYIEFSSEGNWLCREQGVVCVVRKRGEKLRWLALAA